MTKEVTCIVILLSICEITGQRSFCCTSPLAVLLQSLFHLPVFRRLLLNYHLSERVLEKCKSHSVSEATPTRSWRLWSAVFFIVDIRAWGEVSLFYHRTRGTQLSCRSCAASSPSWSAPPAGLWTPLRLWSCCEMRSGPARPNRCDKLQKLTGKSRLIVCANYNC